MVWETDFVLTFLLMFSQNGKTSILSSEVTKSRKMAASLNGAKVLKLNCDHR
jgi:hypothetical protein